MNTYEFTYRIRPDDLDFMKIVGHADWLILFQRARGELCDAIGYPFADVEKDGLGIVIASAQINYLRPAFYDDFVTIKLTAHTLSPKTFFIKHAAQNQKNKLCVVADLQIAFINSESRAVNVPQKIISALDLSLESAV